MVQLRKGQRTTFNRLMIEQRYRESLTMRLRASFSLPASNRVQNDPHVS